jgi:hypothetical protein
MTEVTTAQTEATTAAVAVAKRRVLTTAEKISQLEERIKKDTAVLAALQAEAAADAALADVNEGYTVTFDLGRADTKRTLTGKVIARGLINDKDSVKVLVGTGIDANVYSVAVSTLSAAVAPEGSITDVSQPAPTNPVGDEAETGQLHNDPSSVQVDAGSEVDDLLNGVQL